MDLRHIRYAITIARAGSLRRAAAVLHIAQPTLSEQLRALEKEIGVELFTRSSSGVRLSAAGEAFLAQATVAVAAFERAVAAARRTDQCTRLGGWRTGWATWWRGCCRRCRTRRCGSRRWARRSSSSR
ncbi:LysR family transcriptional regulator [Nonomuraea ferruginea]